MRAPVIVGSTELCFRCGQAPLFPGVVAAGVTYCAACTAELRRLEVARQKRLQASRRRRRLGVGGVS